MKPAAWRASSFIPAFEGALRPATLPCMTRIRTITPLHLDQERLFWEAGLTCVAGVDEVGRGAIAGPLMAGAVVLPAVGSRRLGVLRQHLAGVRDSKTLSFRQRAVLAEGIMALAEAVGIGTVEHDEFDAIGMSAANRLAMERAVLALGVVPDALLLDACTIDLGVPQVGIIGADALCLSVAAASIVAKVARDTVMLAHHERDERYAFAQHKGYGTALHFARIVEHGPGPIHRMSIPRVANGGIR